jgi:hypothetical protein
MRGASGYYSVGVVRGGAFPVVFPVGMEPPRSPTAAERFNDIKSVG